MVYMNKVASSLDEKNMKVVIETQFDCNQSED